MLETGRRSNHLAYFSFRSGFDCVLFKRDAQPNLQLFDL